MAFTTPLTINGEQQTAAYVKAHIRYCDAQRTVIQLDVYTSQASRQAGGQAVPSDWIPRDFSELVQFDTNTDLQAANPIDYAYQLLQASGEFPDAVWNI